MAQYLDKTGLTTLWAKIKKQDYKSLYNLGAYDTISANADGTYTITRQTGHFTIEAKNIISTFTSGGSKVFTAETNIILPNAVTDWNQEFGTSNIGYQVRSLDGNWIYNKSIGGIGGQTVKIGNNDFTTIDQFKELCPINIQYKMTTSYTEEIIEGQPLITLDQQGSQWLRDEWEKGLNLCDAPIEIGDITSTGDGSATDRSRTRGYIKVRPNTTYTICGYNGGTQLGGLNVFFYDGNKGYQSLLYGKTFTTSANTYYIRAYGDIMNSIMLNYGDHPYPYQPYNGEIVHDKDIADLYKQEYNLGYYDTMVENSDGTYTITRQTGYVILNGSEDGWGIYLQGLWAYIKLYNIIPVTNQNNVGQFITNRGPAVSITTMVNTSSGIQIAQDGMSINIRPNVSSINSLDTFKQWLSQNNIAIQYKLATSYTEKVEKNHYARYNERFILEHNKSEAERSANLFNGSRNLSDWGLTVGVKYTIKCESNVRIKIAVYWGAVNPGPDFLAEVQQIATFVYNTNKDWKLFIDPGVNQGNENLNDYKIMCVEGDKPLPYQAYNQNKHITNNEALFLKTEHERSANLFDDNGTNSIQYIGRFYTNDTASNYVLSPHDNYNCFRIRVKQNKTYYIKEINGLILRFEDINNNLVGGKSLFNIGYGAFTTPNGCEYVVFSKAISFTTNVTMLNEGSVALPYQQYEGKVVHEKDIKNLSGVIGYGITQLYRHDIHFDITNGDGIECTFWSTSNNKITDFSQIPYLAFSNIQVKNISSEKILNVVQWNSDGFRFYEQGGLTELIGDAYDGVTAYYINGEPQL